MTSTMQCRACTATLPDNASFCPTCGTPTPTSVNRTTGQTAYAPPSEDTQARSDTRKRVLQAAIGESCEVRELIGRGGFAEVYAGWDVRLKREIAIKTIRADVSSTSLLERFQREAESVAKLRHPHIIPIYGVGEANGTAFFTMPRISGESLAAALEREKRFPVGEACRILSEAAGALEEAHRSGVIHRDIKPENIMLEGRDRRALVMDFGISKSAGTSERGLTGTGMVMGTPEYMSPEQAAGDRELDHRSDQYSLAMIGYRMLAGRAPFEADSVQTLLVKQVTEAPPPLRSIAPDVPEPVAAAVERALAKRPEERFPSMGEFAAALSAARETGTGGAIRRHASTMSDRVARVRALVPRWRAPLVIAGVVGAIAFIALKPRSVPDAALQLAAQREDAMFAARAHLASREITGPLDSETDFESRTASIRFLYENIGSDSAAALVGAGVPLWVWHTRSRPADGPIQHVDVMAGGRIVRHEEVLSDTTSAEAVTPQRAESLAVAELERYGWDVASLRRQPDSVATLRRRADRYFTWYQPDVAVGWEGADSLRLRIRARVSGDRVTDYMVAAIPPQAYERRSEPAVFDAIAIVGWLLVAALLAYAVTLSIARQRGDAVQWRPALMLSAAMIVLFGAGTIPAALTNLNFGTAGVGAAIAALIGLAVFVIILVLVLVTFTFASAESLAAEQDLPVADGVADLTRGRMNIPELATAGIAGTAIGLVIAGVEGLGDFVATSVLGRPTVLDVPEVVRYGTPLAELLPNLGISIGIAVAVMFVQVLLWRRRQSVALIILAPAILLTVLMAGTDGMDVATRITAFATAALVSFAIWRYGLLAGIVAQFIAESAWGMLAVGLSSGASLGTLVAIVGLLLPLAFGVLRYRRLPATASR